MKYVSTRGQVTPLSFAQTLTAGLAGDGGLYVPATLPPISLEFFHGLIKRPFAEFSAGLLDPFLEEDPLRAQLRGICSRAFDFPLPLRYRADGSAVLELFHGPTAAFKDVGARFLAECVVAMAAMTPISASLTVIVATSGDTGGAVAGAFFGKPGVEVLVLFPKGRISARQEKQIASWGGNVRAIAVRGSFDDCQRVVKEALADTEWRRERSFISANSISVGRLLPQMTYYAQASLIYASERGVEPGVIVPTGNLGNAVAALIAKRMGFPIARVVLATNANTTLKRYFQSAKWRPEPTVATLANAMDVGDPSNIERLNWLYPRFEELKREVAVELVNDGEISVAIKKYEKERGEIFCPHTATAAVARERLDGNDWLLVATAHPAKFETIVEPLIGHEVSVPPALRELLEKPSKADEINPSLAALKGLVG